MQQNTKSWLEYRKTKIGASDASAIMGVSPWSSPYQLWLEKMDLTPAKTMTPAMQRGLDLQDKALDCFSSLTGLDTFPDVKQHPKHDFMIASLDGITLDGQHIVEVKCPGPKTHAIAVSGKVPDHYMPQLQHQMEVCGHEHMHYFSFDGTSGVVLDVFRNEAYVEQLIEKEEAFWYCMQNGIPPDMRDSDKTHRKDIEWQILADEWRQCKVAMKDIHEMEERLKHKIVDLCDGKDSYGSGISVCRTFRKNAAENAISWRISKVGD